MKRKFLFLVILGLSLVLPLQQARAVAPLVGVGIAAAAAVVGGWVLQLISLATAGLVTAASGVLHLILYKLPFSYTKLVDPNGAQTLVGVGWPIVRDLVNMLLVIILVFIGLAVALRLKDYEAKKTLIPLIAIALLINFTPVIIGLIVDASNIVMNFFLQDLNPGAYWERHASLQRAIMPTGWELLNPFKHVENTVAASMLIVMDLIIFAIMAMYALLFLTRYVAIWILVILSPLAFACYILPATRKYWSQWWDQLFQWCIIGIIGAFFLYLGTHLFKIVEGMQYTAEGQGMMTELAIKFIPLFMLGIFYSIGLLMAFSTSAMGAKQITAGFKRGYKAAGKTAATRGWKGLGETGKGAGRILGIGTAAVRGKQAYDIIRKQGWSKRQALKAGVGRGVTEWGRQLKPKTMGKAITREMKAAGKGIGSAVRDISGVGLKAGLGIKMKKKGKKSSRKGFMQCPTCNEDIAASAKTCPKCGVSFE